jgi:hypothetical protein
VDPLHVAVAKEFSVRYCPQSIATFVIRFWLLFAVFAVLALAVFVAARTRASNKASLYLIAGVLLLFAFGSGALIFYGLSGCSGAAAAGLTWDWP